MWRKIGKFILAYRIVLLVVLLGIITSLCYWASKAEMSYEFTKAIPADHPISIAYESFRKKYGQDGNLMVVGFQTDSFFTPNIYNTYSQLAQDLKKMEGVVEVVSISTAVNIMKDTTNKKFITVPVFQQAYSSQPGIDSAKSVFLKLPFYKDRLYNMDTKAWLMGVQVNKVIMNTKQRNVVVANIKERIASFGEQSGLTLHTSGLPLIRTELATRIADEMKWFLLASIILSAFILWLFFRSVTTMLLSLMVVLMGVVASVATIELLGYKISMLSALIPPLMVVIGIPNCIYFLTKYHSAYKDTGDKREALLAMIDRMGIVMLFCNIAAAIGFSVFALTESTILKEFGVVSGINIMGLFFISLIFIPISLYYLPTPKPRHLRYLNNRLILLGLQKIELWSINHRKLIYATTLIITTVAVIGITRLVANGYVVDDLPKSDKLQTGLRFFEKNFKGVLPLEILIKTKSKAGIIRDLPAMQKMDQLSNYIVSLPEMAKPLSIIEGLKFAKQSFFEGDSSNYKMPSEFDMPAMMSYLKLKGKTPDTAKTMQTLISSFLDSAKQEARISVSMADVGTKRLPGIIDSLKEKTDKWFPENKYTVTFTGTSVTFLEGSRYIINGLKESIMWAFLLIAACMLYLFKSVKILLCSLIPNVVPLVITAGVMGWAGVALKPSTVLVFSVALGIAIDITIRFLINYKQELKAQSSNVEATVVSTIHQTGISIIYTSLVLIAGFIIFCFSGFGGTRALGWLTSLTLLVSTVTNLVLLPALLISFGSRSKSQTPESSGHA